MIPDSDGIPGRRFPVVNGALMTLLFGSASDAQVPTLGASGAIAAVMGAYLVLYPN